MFIMFRFSLSQYHVHFILTGLGMVRLDLIDDSNTVLRFSQFIIEFGMVQGQGNVGGEL